MKRWPGVPYPDDEKHWIVLSADTVCALVAFGDREFAAIEKADRQRRDLRPPTTTTKGTPR